MEYKVVDNAAIEGASIIFRGHRKGDAFLLSIYQRTVTDRLDGHMTHFPIQQWVRQPLGSSHLYFNLIHTYNLFPSQARTRPIRAEPPKLIHSSLSTHNLSPLITDTFSDIHFRPRYPYRAVTLIYSILMSLVDATECSNSPPIGKRLGNA